MTFKLNCYKNGQGQAVFVYFTLFGLAFLTSSTIYLMNLNKFDNTHCKPLLTGSLTYSDNDVTNTCDNLSKWRRLSIIGIFYGSLWLFAALLSQLCPFLLLNRNGNESQSTGQSGSTYVIMSEQEDKAMTDAAHYFVKLQKKQQQTQKAKQLWTSCRNSLKSWSVFLSTVSFWLAPLLLPGYLVISLVAAGAIRANLPHDSLYFPALALCVTCAINYLVVIVGAVIINQKSTENEEEEDEAQRQSRTWTPTVNYLDETTVPSFERLTENNRNKTES